MKIGELVARVFTPDHLRVFNDWRRQPTTVAGFMALGGTLTALADGRTSWRQASVGLVVAAIGLVFPDNANRKISETIGK